MIEVSVFLLRVISSVGRASPLQGEGRQFEPVITHQPSLLRASAGRPVSFSQ